MNQLNRAPVFDYTDNTNPIDMLTPFNYTPPMDMLIPNPPVKISPPKTIPSLDVSFPKFIQPLPSPSNSGVVYAGDKTINGKVVDVDGTPVMATVVDTNDTTIWAETDFDGNFSLTTKANHVLKISGVGFMPMKLMASAIPSQVVLAYDKDNTINVDLGTIPTTTPVDTSPLPKDDKPNYALWIIGTVLVLGTAGALFNKNERKKMALAGGKKKKKKTATKNRKKTTSKKRTSKKRTVKKKVKR